MALIVTILKYFGFIYYTVTTTSIVVFLHLFFRINRRPNPYFYKLNKPVSKPLLTSYTLFNLFICYLYFRKNYFGYIIYILNELITIIFSYLVLSGFHVYGITGQICSGKTSACEYLKKRYKAAIISLDEINHRILNDRSVIERIKKEFGNEVIMSNNGREIVNRAELKRIIFGDKLKRKKLESITHPKIMMLFFKMLFTQRFLYLKKYVFIENAILLRFKLFKMLLKGTISICVENEKVLIERIMRRDNHGDMNTTEETARNILKNQMSLEEFKSKSDIVIYNDDNYQSLELNIDQIMRDIAMFSKNDRIFVN
jgi:dephospho-CoA kinase